MTKDIVALAAVGTDEIAHVLDEAEVRHFQRVEHLDRAADIRGRHILRRRNDDRAGHGNALGHRQLHVAGPGR